MFKLKTKHFLQLLLAVIVLNVFSQNNDRLVGFIEHYADSVVNQAKQPGLIVSITKGDSIMYEKAKGLANIQTKEPMDTKMRFRIGSLTKTFTTTVVLQLVDEGLLKLDDSIDKFFPNIPNAQNITVRMLGDMSSGLYRYRAAKEFAEEMISKPQKKWKPEELVTISANHSPYF